MRNPKSPPKTTVFSYSGLDSHKCWDLILTDYLFKEKKNKTKQKTMAGLCHDFHNSSHSSDACERMLGSSLLCIAKGKTPGKKNKHAC